MQHRNDAPLPRTRTTGHNDYRLSATGSRPHELDAHLHSTDMRIDLDDGGDPAMRLVNELSPSRAHECVPGATMSSVRVLTLDRR